MEWNWNGIELNTLNGIELKRMKPKSKQGLA
jgi:hypothetical protein